VECQRRSGECVVFSNFYRRLLSMIESKIQCEPSHQRRKPAATASKTATKLTGRTSPPRRNSSSATPFGSLPIVPLRSAVAAAPAMKPVAAASVAAAGPVASVSLSFHLANNGFDSVRMDDRTLASLSSMIAGEFVEAKRQGLRALAGCAAQHDNRMFLIRRAADALKENASSSKKSLSPKQQHAAAAAATIVTVSWTRAVADALNCPDSEVRLMATRLIAFLSQQQQFHSFVIHTWLPHMLRMFETATSAGQRSSPFRNPSSATSAAIPTSPTMLSSSSSAVSEAHVQIALRDRQTIRDTLSCLAAICATHPKDVSKLLDLNTLRPLASANDARLKRPVRTVLQALTVCS